MRLLLIGPPGSGKGTQGARIAERYDVEHIATGDILRAEVAADTALGRTVTRYMQAGRLVPDNLILDIVMPRVLAAAASTGYVLDGFPRSLPQAVIAREISTTEHSEVRRAVLLDVSRGTLLTRLSTRAQAQGRADDTPEVIAARLEVFAEATAPMLDFYRERGLLHVVDGSLPADEVTQQIIAALPALVRATSKISP